MELGDLETVPIPVVEHRTLGEPELNEGFFLLQYGILRQTMW